MIEVKEQSVGIRETLNQNQRMAAIVMGGAVVLAILVIVYEMWPEGQASMTRKSYYSDDDGKTYFVDDIGKIVPYLHNGKPAVLAHVYQCEGSKEKFVGYLQKYTDQVRAQLEYMAASD